MHTISPPSAAVVPLKSRQLPVWAASLGLAQKLYALVLLAALPLAGVAAYEAVSGWHQSKAIADEFPRYELAVRRETQFKTFVDGVADAVDSGTLSGKALQAVKDAQQASIDLQALGAQEDSQLGADLGVIAQAVGRSKELAALMPLREPIQRGQKAIAAASAQHHEQLEAIVNGSISGARRDAAIALVVVLLFTTAALWCGRGLIRSILRMVVGVRLAADRIAEESQALAAEARQSRERVEHQSREVAAVSGAIDRMVSDINEVSGHAVATAQAAGHTRQVAEEAGRNMQATAQCQTGLARRVEDSTAAIRALSQAIDSIGAIGGTIQQIAHQTNLLAINASIEAARAGSQGKGFAVVATEVRHLAARTSTSTQDIRARVEHVAGDSERAVKAIATVNQVSNEIGLATDATTGILNQILAAAANLDGLAGKIAETAGQQQASAGRVAENLDRIQGLMHDNGQSIEQVNQSSQRLVDTVLQMQRQVAELKVPA
jgi:methyl-accepting chemotaxis protein